MVQPGTVAARTVPLGSWPGRARYVPGGWGAGFATPMVLVGFSSASKNEDNLAPGLAGRQRIVGTIRQDGTGSGAPEGLVRRCRSWVRTRWPQPPAPTPAPVEGQPLPLLQTPAAQPPLPTSPRGGASVTDPHQGRQGPPKRAGVGPVLS